MTIQVGQHRFVRTWLLSVEAPGFDASLRRPQVLFVLL